jgi:crossover junction endodeoxyribonuclease RuvC
VFANSLDGRAGRRTRVLGIDPGLTRCGYAVLDGRGPTAAEAVSLGVIRTPSTDPLPRRLGALRTELAALIADFEPDSVAVEQVFFQVNVRTAMSVGQASGLALAEAAIAGCEVIQYTPNQVKDAVAGWGGADKAQVQRMVQARLGLRTRPRPADAADAAALALCHLAMAPYTHRLSGVAR